MLMPKRVKRRRVHRKNLKGNATSGNTITYGEYGLQTLQASRITANQIEAARIAINRKIRRGGKVWIKIFPHTPITKKPAEVRMGSGKGAPDHWVALVRPGRIMFELAGVDEELAKEAFRLAAMKLPVKCKFIKRTGDFVVEFDAKKQKLLNEKFLQEADAAIEASHQEQEDVSDEKGGESDE